MRGADAARKKIKFSYPERTLDFARFAMPASKFLGPAGV
jgi:hypothetical protein